METFKETLEAYIDSNSVGDTLTVLADICREKAAHIQEAWQDEETAKVWIRQARALEYRATQSHRTGL